VRHYVIGVALGSVPFVVLFLIGHFTVICPWGAQSGVDCTTTAQIQGTLACLYGLLYLVQLAVTIPMLRNEEWRYLGYGLLTMLLLGPVVAMYACSLATTPPPA
jgi:hypothetical protein